MSRLDKDELDILEEVLNEELFSYLDSGYELTSDYAITLRTMLNKLNLKERYDFDRRYGRNK